MMSRLMICSIAVEDLHAAPEVIPGIEEPVEVGAQMVLSGIREALLEGDINMGGSYSRSTYAKEVAEDIDDYWSEQQLPEWIAVDPKLRVHYATVVSKGILVYKRWCIQNTDPRSPVRFNPSELPVCREVAAQIVHQVEQTKHLPLKNPAVQLLYRPPEYWEAFAEQYKDRFTPGKLARLMQSPHPHARVEQLLASFAPAPADDTKEAYEAARSICPAITESMVNRISPARRMKGALETANKMRDLQVAYPDRNDALLPFSLYKLVTRFPEEYLEKGRSFLDSLDDLQHRYAGNQDIMPSTLHYYAILYLEEAEKHVQQYFSRLEKLRELADAIPDPAPPIVQSHLKNLAKSTHSLPTVEELRTSLAIEELINAGMVKTRPGLKRWMLERVVTLYSDATTQDLKYKLQAVSDLTQKEILTVGRYSSHEIAELLQKNARQYWCSKSGEYIRFNENSKVGSNTLDQMAIAVHYGIDLLMYGHSAAETVREQMDDVQRTQHVTQILDKITRERSILTRVASAATVSDKAFKMLPGGHPDKLLNNAREAFARRGESSRYALRQAFKALATEKYPFPVSLDNPKMVLSFIREKYRSAQRSPENNPPRDEQNAEIVALLTGIDGLMDATNDLKRSERIETIQFIADVMHDEGVTPAELRIPENLQVWADVTLCHMWDTVVIKKQLYTKDPSATNDLSAAAISRFWSGPAVRGFRLVYGKDRPPGPLRQLLLSSKGRDVEAVLAFCRTKG